MEELIKNLNSISWWVTVVIAGIIISLISAYLKIGIDKLFYKISIKRRKKKKIEFEEIIKQAKLHPKGEFDLTVLNFAATRNYIRGMHQNLLSIFLLLFAFFLVGKEQYIFAVILMIFAFYTANSALFLVKKSMQQIDLISYIYRSKLNISNENILI